MEELRGLHALWNLSVDYDDQEILILVLGDFSVAARSSTFLLRYCFRKNSRLHSSHIGVPIRSVSIHQNHHETHNPLADT
jgi:hypothetical protein